MSKLRFIGDVHGQFEFLREKQDEADFSLTVGDIGYDYSALDGIYQQRGGYERHRMIKGNHELHPLLNSPKRPAYFLDNFGVWELPGGLSVFYLGGAWSIDHAYRTPGVDWFPEEELSGQELSDAIDLYSTVKPHIVATHEAPFCCIPYVTDPSFAKQYGYTDPIKTATNWTLQMFLRIHQPISWFFGHYHKQGGRQFKLSYRTIFTHLDMLRPFGNRGGNHFDIDF